METRYIGQQKQEMPECGPIWDVSVIKTLIVPICHEFTSGVFSYKKLDLEIILSLFFVLQTAENTISSY